MPRRRSTYRPSPRPRPTRCRTIAPRSAAHATGSPHEISCPRMAGRPLPPNATVLINNVSLAYALASDKNGKDYLQPVYLFSGTVAIPGQRASADVRIAVPAVRNVQQPTG